MMNVNTSVWAYPDAYCPECSKCSKPIGVYQCIGCGKVFCSEDTKHHRQVLRNDLHELIHESEQWNAYWNDEIRKHQNVLKIKQEKVFQEIDDWERKAMAKIREASAQAREETQRLFEHHMHISIKWTALDVSALKRAMETDGFLETHLSQWKRQLRRLQARTLTFKSDFIRLKHIDSFISKLTVEGDYQCYDHIETNADIDSELLEPPILLMVPVERDFDPYNQGELKSGVHEFRYKTKSIFFGVQSKKAYQAKEPWNTPSTYGWTGDDLVYLNAKPVRGYGGYRSNFELGDTYLLKVNCDQKTIRLTNERTNDSHSLNVDPTKCPLPWQLNVRFLDYTHP